MSRSFHVFSLSVMLLLVVCATDALAQRPGGFGRRGGSGGPRRPDPVRMGRAMAIQAFNIEAIWTDLAFKLNVRDEQLTHIRSVLLPMWKDRDLFVAQAQKDDDWEWLQNQLKSMKKQFDEKLKTILAEDQQKEFAKLQKDRDKQFERQREQFQGRSDPLDE